jgi:hypothetical protein
MSANPGHNKEQQLARTYETDRVYLPGDASEEQLYQDEVSSLVDSLYQGVNSALLAYGECGANCLCSVRVGCVVSKWKAVAVAGEGGLSSLVDSLYEGCISALLAHGVRGHLRRRYMLQPHLRRTYWLDHATHVQRSLACG